MKNYSTNLCGLKFSNAAIRNIEETSADVQDDINRVADGESVESLLARCLKGADEDREQGWRDYAHTVADHADTLPLS